LEVVRDHEQQSHTLLVPCEAHEYEPRRVELVGSSSEAMRYCRHIGL